jgi:hypothetical protein
MIRMVLHDGYEWGFKGESWSLVIKLGHKLYYRNKYLIY